MDSTGQRTNEGAVQFGVDLRAATRINKETLSERALRLRKALVDSATGPLIVAKEIVDIADNWLFYSKEVDGAALNTWLQSTFGHRIAWFTRRYDAVMKLGEASRRVLDHNAAVWLADAITDAEVKQVMPAVCRERKAQHDIPLDERRTRDVVVEMFGEREPRRGAGAYIFDLEEEIERLRAERDRLIEAAVIATNAQWRFALKAVLRERERLSSAEAKTNSER